MSKYEKYSGVVNFKIGDDDFVMQPSIKEWVKMFKIWDKDSVSKTDFTEVEVNQLVEVISSSISRADPETNVDVIKKFVENNFFSCMSAFTNMIEKDNELNSFVKKQREKLNNG